MTSDRGFGFAAAVKTATPSTAILPPFDGIVTSIVDRPDTQRPRADTPCPFAGNARRAATPPITTAASAALATPARTFDDILTATARPLPWCRASAKGVYLVSVT